MSDDVEDPELEVSALEVVDEVTETLLESVVDVLRLDDDVGELEAARIDIRGCDLIKGQAHVSYQLGCYCLMPI